MPQACVSQRQGSGKRRGADAIALAESRNFVRPDPVPGGQDEHHGDIHGLAGDASP